MAFVLKDGKILIVDGKIATSTACCPPDTCPTGFSMTVGSATFPDADPCTFLAAPNLCNQNSGPAYWDFDCDPDDGFTYEILSKPGFPGSCQNCELEEFDETGYVSRGSLGGATTTLRIYREDPATCNDDNPRCWLVKATHACGLFCRFCPESTSDTNNCYSCCDIDITIGEATCIPFEGGNVGVASVSATFVITIPFLSIEPEDCDSIFGDGTGVTWTMQIGGVTVATGTGLTGGGTGDQSCTCPTEDPCALTGADVSVEWCLDGVCCGS